MSVERAPPGGCLDIVVITVWTISVFMVISCCAVGSIGWYIYSLIPDEVESGVVELVGISVVYPTLSSEDSDKVSAAGLDPEAVALALEASNYVQELTGANVGPGIILAIFQGETSGGQNVGSCSARYGATHHDSLDANAEIAALEWLLNHWREHNVREKNPLAAENIKADFSDATAHCGADAMGVCGFIATTGKRICQKYLVESGDPEFISCDFWSDRVAFHMTGLYLADLGYSKELSLAEKTKILWGWCQDRAYGQRLASSAAEYAKQLANLGVTYDRRAVAGFGDFEGYEWWIQLLVDILELLDLLPDEIHAAQQWAAEQVPSGTTGEGDVVLNLQTEVPVADGESYNVALWAAKNNPIEIEMGQTWSFCTQTGRTGWGDYKFAAGYNAGGICINSSMLHELASRSQYLQVVESHTHANVSGYPRFTHAVLCPGKDLKIRNVSDHTVVLEWARSGDQLILRERDSGVEAESSEESEG